MDPDELLRIVEAHQKWLDTEGEEGAQAVLLGVDLSGIDFTNVNFEGAALTGSNLSGSNFERATLANANLEDCDLSGTTLAWADLSSATLEGATVNGETDLYGACLNHAKVDYVDWSEVAFDFVDVQGVPSIIDGGLAYGFVTDDGIRLKEKFGGPHGSSSTRRWVTEEDLAEHTDLRSVYDFISALASRRAAP